MTRVGHWVVLVAGAGIVWAGASDARRVTAASQRAPASCCTVAGADFPKVGGNFGNQNNSSLARIDRRNVSRLGGAWHLNLEGGPAGAGAAAGGQQSSAIAVNGVLYIETSQGNVYAVHGATGQIKWSYRSGAGIQFRRGVAAGEGRVFTATAGKRIVALDQQTGAVVWTHALGDDDGSRGSVKSAITYYDGMIYVGNADAALGIGYALSAKDGHEVWRVYGPAPKGQFGGDTWEGDSAASGGASPWMHPAIDPELGLLYWTFGNARGGGATDGSTRGGQNLFANSIVAINAKTGQRVWHFQSVHHDIWDMDNVMAPVLADLPVNGRVRKVVVYGSKTGMYYVLDRVDGSAITPIDETPVPQEPAQKTWPTQPIPRGDAVLPICPNTDASNRVPPHYQFGCLYTPHTDVAVVQSPGTGGGMTWNAVSFDPRTRLIYTGVGIVNSGHVQHDGGVGFRPLGEDRSGRIVALNPATHNVVWSKNTSWSLAHGNGVLTTAGGVMFIGQPDGLLLALDIRDGTTLWQWQTGAGVHTSPLTYEVDGEQYVAVLAGGNALPYNSPRGDDFWAFKLGGTVSPAPTPEPPPMRQPITAAAVDGASINNTVAIARNWSGGKVSAEEVMTPNSMAPQHLRVPVGTKVTFVNPVGNAQPHCVTQFYEGLFASPTLAPGQSFSYMFTKAGEYFYNDCTSPRTTGKIVVVAPVAPVKQP